MGKVLIAYNTKTDTTKEVAEEIAKTFKENELEVDMLAISDIESIEGYKGVIIGAPINAMQWVPEAMKFAEDNQEALKNMPTACYFVSYLIVEGRTMWKNIIKKSLNGVKKMINPVSVGMFGGRIASQFPGPVRFLFGVRKGAPLDVRDWDAIQGWADEVVTKFL